MSDSIKDFLQSEEALVKRHQVASDSEDTTMRSISEIKDLLAMQPGLGCDGKANVMRGVFLFRGKTQQFGSQQ